MSNLEKPFLTVDQQIKKLEARGLQIHNVEKAKMQLLRTSYYDLINGYKDMFLLKEDPNQKEEEFIEGTTFEDIVELYQLDRRIRHTLLEALLDVEAVFYSSVAYSIAEAYGEKQADYLKKENYRIGRKQWKSQRYERDNLLYKINSKLDKPEVEPLIYYKKKYDNIPPWILVKDLSFGELVMLYKLSRDSVKTDVIRHIIGEAPTEEDKEFFLKCVELFNKFRNWAAHGGRMYNHRTRTELPYLERMHQLMPISKEEFKKGTGKNDFAAVVLGMMYFYQKNPLETLEFFINLNTIMEEYQKKKPLQYEQVLAELGLPSNYYKAILEKYMYKRNPSI